ncbi:MAG: SRPBCC family protein [Armatimonadetes bacterium]|nr:SRPBCC family protein [Armatimonadota bacterium]
MLTRNAITIRAPAGRIFQLAAEVERWPELLPHYRWVRVLARDGNRKTVEMAAHRDGFPVKWRAVQEVRPADGVIRFAHVRGVTKGMQVEWRLQPRAGGEIEVSITHELAWPRPLRWFADIVIGEMFVRNIAGKTLRRIKELAEATAEDPLSRPGRGLE